MIIEFTPPSNDVKLVSRFEVTTLARVSILPPPPPTPGIKKDKCGDLGKEGRNKGKIGLFSLFGRVKTGEKVKKWT